MGAFSDARGYRIFDTLRRLAQVDYGEEQSGIFSSGSSLRSVQGYVAIAERDADHYWPRVRDGDRRERIFSFVRHGHSLASRPRARLWRLRETG